MKKSTLFYSVLALAMLQLTFIPNTSFSQSESTGSESSTATTYTKTESRVNSDNETQHRTCVTYETTCAGSGVLVCTYSFRVGTCTPWW